MPRIAEKVEFITARAVKVCAGTGIGRSLGHNIQCFCGVF
jgi:hypothetical protein